MGKINLLFTQSDVSSVSEVDERSEPIWTECRRHVARYALLSEVFILIYFLQMIFVASPWHFQIFGCY